ncbi:MAG TPA: Mut7-C RNAse domain-containing protein [Candidatus Nitrosotalea sp.]|nr:Mut7-C RNAse domain-containing protein [Candidatus Nitrosotalea sp.]
MSTNKPIFVVDAMLGNLAKKLRILGYDSKYFSSIEDDKLILIAKNEKRIILTKDEQLTKNAEKQNIGFVLIRGSDESEQIMQINAKIKLDRFVVDTNNSRCIVCNGSLQPVEKYRIIGKIPEGILEREKKFWMCDSCKKIYWEGTHFEKLQEFATKLNDMMN